MHQNSQPSLEIVWFDLSRKLNQGISWPCCINIDNMKSPPLQTLFLDHLRKQWNRRPYYTMWVSLFSVVHPISHV